MSDPSPSHDQFAPIPPGAPASPTAPVAPPVPSVPPTPTQVRTGGFEAGPLPPDTAWGTPPAPGPFIGPGSTRRVGLGTKLLFPALALAGVIFAGIVTGHLHFFASTSSTQPPQAAPPNLGQASNGHFGGDRITFRYPKAWQSLSGVKFPQGGALPPAAQTVLVPHAAAGQVASAVIVETYAAPQPRVTRAQLQAQLSTLLRGQGGSLEGPVVVHRLGNLPGYEVRMRTPSPVGGNLREHLYFGYQGSTEYFVNCQAMPADQAQIAAGCAQIVRTFHVEGTSS